LPLPAAEDWNPLWEPFGQEKETFEKRLLTDLHTHADGLIYLLPEFAVGLAALYKP